MGEHAFFYASQNGDRKYGADSFSEWLAKFFTSGVFDGDLGVTANGNMSVTVAPGYANYGGKVKVFDAAQTLAIATANSSYPRIDTVVVERNDTDRDFTVKVVQGNYSGSTPTPPKPVRANGVYQLVLAQIRVNAGATSISQANITDKRLDETVCGIVKGTVEELKAADYLKQFTAQFDAWFDGIKGKLTTDAAGNLQAQIDDLAADVAAGSYSKFTAVAVSQTGWSQQSSSASDYYADYPYRKAIPLSGVTQDMTPYVVFNPKEVVTGYFAPIANAYNGGIYIYSKSHTTYNFSIPTIICWR